MRSSHSGVLSSHPSAGTFHAPLKFDIGASKVIPLLPQLLLLVCHYDYQISVATLAPFHIKFLASCTVLLPNVEH